MALLKIKIGRHDYEISTDDQFMDNGACVQLLTQSKEKSIYGKRPNPVLSKRAVWEINKFSKRQINGYGQDVKVFTLDIC